MKNKRNIILITFLILILITLTANNVHIILPIVIVDTLIINECGN